MHLNDSNNREETSITINHVSLPNLLEISELCILGFSRAIFLLCILDQTINAFMGLFT